MNADSAAEPAVRPTREECVAAAQAIADRAWAEMAMAYAEGGAVAVAALRHEPGVHREQIAARYERWVQEEHARQAKGSAASGLTAEQERAARTGPFSDR